MKTTTKKISDTRVELTVTLDKDDLKIAKDKAIERLAKEVKVEALLLISLSAPLFHVHSTRVKLHHL